MGENVLDVAASCNPGSGIACVELADPAIQFVVQWITILSVILVKYVLPVLIVILVIVVIKHRVKNRRNKNKTYDYN